MVANRGDHIFVVVNAACKAKDIAHMKAALGDAVVTEVTNRALLALQGPASESVLAKLDPKAREMRFMDVATLHLNGVACEVARAGYTGEDGFEISVPADDASDLARCLIEDAEVEPIGLGARDSLRLEAGLCLYGHDIGPDTTPVEAGLGWAIQKVRRLGGARAGGFPGADRILAELNEGATRKRVGLRPEGRAPMRAGVELFAHENDTTPIGHITSGGFGPTVGAPVAMGYVAAGFDTSRHQGLWRASRQTPAPDSDTASVHTCTLQALTFEEMPMKYTQEHEWLRLENDLVVVGITDYAATQLGDIVFIELPEIGHTVSKGDDMVVIESVKAASEIAAPLDGQVVEVNEALAENPALANEDATGKAWFFKVKPSNVSQLDEYMDEAAYKALIG
jgi:glycine cleavage system H protein